MNIEKSVFNKLTKVELESQKYDFALADEFKASFNKANDEQAKILSNLIDSLNKAQGLLKENSSIWNKASVIGKQIIDKSKELGVEVPATLVNGIKIADVAIKENQTSIGKMSQLISSF